MKIINSGTKKVALLSGVFLIINSCFSQDVITTNNPDAGVSFEEFHPAISGLGSNDVALARQTTSGIVFFNKASGQAIVRASTNGVCFYKGKFFFATSSGGPEQAIYINVSQPFGTNEFNADQALVFSTQVKANY